MNNKNEPNETEELEMLLRSWKPRRPSANFERRITAAATRTAIEPEPPRSFKYGWLAPATALLVLLCLVHNPRGYGSLGSGTAGTPMVALILSNQSAASYLPGSFTADQNRLGETFEWTNQGGFTSSNSSLSPAKVKQSQ